MPRKPTRKPKPTAKPKKPNGRPQKIVDWNSFEKLCGLQCTLQEASSFLGVSQQRLLEKVKKQYGDSFANVYKRFSENGKCSLRRNQFVLSRKSASMAIWLGKIWLGQKDPSLEEVKDFAQNVIINAIKKISTEPRIDASSRPVVETQQLVLDQEHMGTTTEI